MESNKRPGSLVDMAAMNQSFENGAGARRVSVIAVSDNGHGVPVC